METIKEIDLVQRINKVRILWLGFYFITSNKYVWIHDFFSLENDIGI